MLIERNRKLICDNSILESVKEYSNHQIKLLYFVLYKFKVANMVNSNVEDIESLELYLYEEEIKELFQTKGMTFYEMGQVVESIPKGINLFNSSNGEFTYISIFNMAKYKPEIGEYYFKLNEDIVPLINEIEKNFSVVPIDELLKLSGKYSPRIFEIYCRYKNMQFVKMTASFLRVFLKVPASYNVGNMDLRVLRPAIKEIKDKLGINITYTKDKKRGIITHYLFKFN